MSVLFKMEIPELLQLVNAVVVPAKKNDSVQANLEDSADLREAKRGRERISMRGKAIQKYQCGNANGEVWQITEILQVKIGDGGFDPEKMLRFAQTKFATEDLMNKELAQLLAKFVESKMSMPAGAPAFTSVLQPSVFVGGVVAKDEEAFTFPRLAMTFPYNTAVERSRLFQTCASALSHPALLPGIVGDLPPVLAFPYAGLIIPTIGWEKTAKDWESWYFSFIEQKVGFLLPLALQDRVIEQIRVMRALATENHAGNVKMMTRLGLTPPDKTLTSYKTELKQINMFSSMV